MLLYDNDLSGNCYKVRLLFAQLGIQYEARELSVFDRTNRPEVLGGLNPALRVPTLVLDDGRTLAESNAILCYFAEGTSLLPEDRFERAQVLQWLFFEQYSHEPYIAVARFWAHAGITPPDAEQEAKQRGGIAALKAMEDHLRAREYLVGERYTIADIALYAYTHVAPEGGFELEPYAAVRAWLERVRSQAGHVTIDARPPVG
jgi:glutathione S-transferase